jgi:hypothetical protein
MPNTFLPFPANKRRLVPVMEYITSIILINKVFLSVKTIRHTCLLGTTTMVHMSPKKHPWGDLVPVCLFDTTLNSGTKGTTIAPI